LKSHDV
jgi:hypothetical protein